MHHFLRLVRQTKVKKDVEPAEFFSDNPVDLNSDYANNRTLLQNAIMDQEEELFDAILHITAKDATKPPDLNLRDRTGKGWSALHYAVFQSSTAGPSYVQKLVLVD